MNIHLSSLLFSLFGLQESHTDTRRIFLQSVLAHFLHISFLHLLHLSDLSHLSHRLFLQSHELFSEQSSPQE